MKLRRNTTDRYTVIVCMLLVITYTTLRIGYNLVLHRVPDKAAFEYSVLIGSSITVITFYFFFMYHNPKVIIDDAAIRIDGYFRKLVIIIDDIKEITWIKSKSYTRKYTQQIRLDFDEKTLVLKLKTLDPVDRELVITKLSESVPKDRQQGDLVRRKYK